MKRRNRKLKNRLRPKEKGKTNGKMITKHHLIPKSRGGKSNPRNLLLITMEKHRCWHLLFGNRTLHETIALLQKLEKLKRRQK